VISDKMDKTAVIEVERLVMDPLYGKYLRRRSASWRTTRRNECKSATGAHPGVAPALRHKRWVVKEILERASE